MTKTLPIAEALYPSYLLILLFENTNSYFVYAKDILCIEDINKSLGNKQLYLCNNWF